MSPDHSTLHRRLQDDQDGLALVFVLFAVLILAASATIVFRMALTESAATGAARDFENALPVTEAGIDAVIAVLNQENDFTTEDLAGNPHVLDLAANNTIELQKTWALGVAQDATACDAGNDETFFLASGGGEVCAIRPVDSVGNPIDLIFGVGFVPSRANATKTRVVRVEYDRGFFSPSQALLTDGNLTISGNPDILGAAGNVHTNGNLNISGSATVEGEVSYSGTGAGTFTRPDGTIVTPTQRIPEFIPVFDARSLYDEHVGRWTDWYNLCPDGTVWKVDVNVTDTTPCDTVNENKVYDKATDPDEFRGLKWSKTSNTTAKWDVSGNDTLGDGVYYVVNGEVTISGNPGSKSNPVRVSFIIQATVVCGQTADDDGSLSGNYKMSGNSVFQPFVNDLMVIADRDVEWSGNPSQDVEGFVGAVEQIKVSGNPSLNGALLTQDRCDTRGGSPVSENSISGNMDLTFNGGLAVPLDGIIRITAWNEL